MDIIIDRMVVCLILGYVATGILAIWDNVTRKKLILFCAGVIVLAIAYISLSYIYYGSHIC